MRARVRRTEVQSALLLAGMIVWLLAPSLPARQSTFAERIATLSEPGGYFDTDNLISNERSYLHVSDALAKAASPAGAYIGVGPDQNFSYIARVRPAIAIIIDIRRDNLLLHLLFKALFELAPTRIEYVSMLTGRSPPGTKDGWTSKPIGAIVAYIDAAPRLGETARKTLDGQVRAAVRASGVALSDGDHETVRRFHQRFIESGLSLQFNSAGRAPQWDYPTYRDLLLETDRAGVQRSFLSSESDFAFVRDLQQRDLVIPVVGDLAGPRALSAVGRFLAGQRAPLAALYTSNVEYYLFSQGRFDEFVANLGSVPRTSSAVVVRSAFRGALRIEPGYNSASLTQPVDALVAGHAAGRFRTYGDLLAASR